MKGASWRRPYGLESVAYSDALAYAKSLTPCATGSFVKDTNDEKDRNFPVPRSSRGTRPSHSITIGSPKTPNESAIGELQH